MYKLGNLGCHVRILPTRQSLRETQHLRCPGKITRNGSLVAKEKKTLQAEENKSNGSLAREARACITIVQLGWSIKRRVESQTGARFQKRFKCELRNLTRIWEEMTERPECSRVPRNVIDQSLTNVVLVSFAGMLPSIFTFSSSGKPATVTVL